MSASGAVGAPAETRVALFTGTHRVLADVDTRQRRLVEVLRDATRSLLDVSNVVLTRLEEPKQLAAGSPRGLIRKADIQLAAILTEADRGDRRLYNYVAKSTVRVLVVLPGCEVTGELYLAEGQTDAIIGYLKMTDAFFHLTNAQIRFTRGALATSAANTVIVNRAAVELFCLAE